MGTVYKCTNNILALKKTSWSASSKELRSWWTVFSDTKGALDVEGSFCSVEEIFWIGMFRSSHSVLNVSCVL